MRGPARKRVTDGTLVEGASEEVCKPVSGPPVEVDTDVWGGNAEDL